MEVWRKCGNTGVQIKSAGWDVYLLESGQEGMDTEDTKEEKLVKTCLKAQTNERAIHRTAYTTHLTAQATHLTAQAKGRARLYIGLSERIHEKL